MKKIILLSIILVSIVLVSGCVGETASDCFIKTPKKIQSDVFYGLNLSNIDSDYMEVHLPENLCIDEYPQNIDGYYFVTCTHPYYKDNITSLGATVVQFYHEDTYLVKMSDATKGDIEKLGFVRWVGIFQPAYRITSVLRETNRTGEMDLMILLFSDEDLELVADKLRSLHGVISTPINNPIRVKIDASKIPNIANINEISLISEYSTPALF